MLFVPLSLTSTDAAVRALGQNWKRLQRLAYVLALLTLAHWILLDGQIAPGLIHAAPVLVLRGAAWVQRRRHG